MIEKQPKTGKLGENIAKAYLLKKGYKILDQNYRKKFGEIDLIARVPDGTLIFCEVKAYIKRGTFPVSFGPEDNANRSKLMKMRRMANFFAAENPKLIVEEKGWRIDLIAITLERVGESKVAIQKIGHYENVV